eukprot:CAMPEP_0117030798 /NCGR_PEP_ID=MMETSP0472-20121206/22203_1 /TAXON_ID=693140 ORGANISM="Tiarina fusus, Strain LIS" /NCGR_SAMPLE_ID=MMETSP0472 /ASSEMBLY_ACC=CAM_ASM_000603 /LENGTH=105 /DNA_ID=CAMNT_0004738977 /DNA_START=418 /DNA_END=736 /DNA_ORIENTATION=-
MKAFCSDEARGRGGVCNGCGKIPSTSLDHVLVAGHAGSLEGGGGELFLLVRHQMGDEGEVIYVGLLGTAIEDSDLSIGHTSAESALDVGLILLKSGATSRSSSHD